jgi:hypothetical protein
LSNIRDKIKNNYSDNKRYADLMWILSFFPEDETPLELVKVLYKIGIIGFQAEKTGEPIFVYKSEDILETFEITADSRFQVHPMIRNPDNAAKKKVKEDPWG